MDISPKENTKIFINILKGHNHMQNTTAMRYYLTYDHG